MSFSIRPALLLSLSAAAGMAGAAFAEEVPLYRYRDPGYELRQSLTRSRLPSRLAQVAPAPLYTLDAVSREELYQALTRSELQAPFAGLHRAVADEVINTGRWEPAGPGQSLWRLAIHSPGAAGLRLHIDAYQSASGRLWVHDGAGDGAQVFGPYGNGGPYSTGEFWTDVVVGDTLFLEFESPAGGGSGPPPFRIEKLAHILAGLAPDRPALAPELRAKGLHSPEVRAALDALLTPAAKTPDRNVGSCHLDVSCYDAWTDTAKSVGWVVFETDQGTAVCSGTLINTRNNSGRPYFLTADHCISSEATARTMTVFWFYQTASCGAAAPDYRNLPRSRALAYLGGKNYTQGDSSLILLEEVPSGVSFSGWITDTPPDASEVIGVSHPAGSYKRISFGLLGSRSRDSGVPARDEDFYGVRYAERGLVEPGSSGSGLFSAPGVLVGILSHGRKPTDKSNEAYCNFLPFSVNYGRFSVSYPLFRDLLEDRATTTPPPTTPGAGAGPGNQRVLNSGDSLTVTLGPVASPTLFNGADGYQIVVGENNSRLDIRVNFPVPADVALFVRVGSPPVVSLGQVLADWSVEGPGGVKSLSITSASSPPIKAGTYYIALALRSTNAKVAGSLSVTITPNQGRALTSGVVERLRFNSSSAPTWLVGASGFSVAVPDGATRLEIRVSSAELGDIDLFVRYGQPPTVSGRTAAADYKSDGFGPSETIVITPASNPPLRAGVYYIAVLNYNNTTGINAELRATITGGVGGSGPSGTRRLVSASPVYLRLGPVSVPTMYNGTFSYTVDVPEGATRFEIKLAPVEQTTTNVDLYVRLGQDVTIDSNGRAVAEWRSEGAVSDETIVILPSGTPALRGGTYYVALGLRNTNTTFIGHLTATWTGGVGPRISGRRSLVSGQPVFLNVTSSGAGNEVFNGDRGFVVNVPEGATKLEITTVGLQTGSGMDVDLLVRYGGDVDVSGNNVLFDFLSENWDNNEKITITPTSRPALRAGLYYIAFWKWWYSSGSTNLMVTATVTGGTSAPPPAGGTPRALSPGQAARFFIGPVESPTLFNGGDGFSVTVPQGATRLEIRLATETPNADVDLLVRRASEPVVEGGEVKADFWPAEPSGSEILVINTNSSPPLQAGTYYIALGLFTTRLAVSGTVTVNYTSGDPGGTTPGATNELTSGQARTVNVPAVSEPGLFNGNNGFRIQVPQGATRLDIKLTSPASGVDLDLYARFGQDVVVSGGRVQSDHASEGAAAEEYITVTPQSSPALRPGTYYIAYAMFTVGRTATATITATVTGGGGGATPPPSTGPRRLTSGQAANYSIGPVTSPTLFNGANGFLIDVPANATRLEITLRTPDASSDVDLHARAGQDVGLANGRVVADTSSSNADGNESIVLSGAALRPGSYYIALGLFTLNRTVTGTITATVTTGSGGTTPSRNLVSGIPVTFKLGPVESPTLFSGANSYQVQVPAGATRLELRLSSSTPNVDLDLYARFGQDNAVADGRPVTDHSSEGPTGSETLIITPQSNPPLRAGTYFVSFGLFTTGVEASATLSATISGGGGGGPTPPPPSTTATVLTPGTPGKFSYPAVTTPTLFSGNSGFRLTVPEGATRVVIRIASDQTNVDADLFVRLNSDVEVRDGEVVADYASATDSGTEQIAITPSSNPPLRAGTYYIAIGVSTTNTPASGVISATVERGTVAPPISTAPVLTPGLPARIDLPATDRPVVFGGDLGFRVVVPANGSRLDINLNTDDQDIDIDVLARFNQEPAVNQAGGIVTDHSSVSETVGNERIVIDRGGAPPLRAGVYFISFAVYTTGRPVKGAISVTVGTGSTLGDFSFRKPERVGEGEWPLALKSYGPIIQPFDATAFQSGGRRSLPRRYSLDGDKPRLRVVEEE